MLACSRSARHQPIYPPIRLNHPVFAPARFKTTYVKHACSREKAIEQIMEHEKKRLLAPLKDEFPRVEGVQISEDNPFKSVYFPVYRFKARVSNLRFDGNAIYQRFVLEPDPQDHSKTITTIRYEYVYFPPIELREELYYDGKTSGFTIAGCDYSYHEMVEEAFDRSEFKGSLQDYHESSVKADKIFKFDLSFKDAAAIAKGRFRNKQRQRAINEVFKRYGCADVQLMNFQMSDEIEIKDHMLPAYMLQYPKTPPIILSAISQKGRVIGGGLLSPAKLGAIAMAAATVASFFFPALRVGILAAGAMGYTFGLKGREWQHTLNEKMHEYKEPEEEGRVKSRKNRKKGHERIEGSPGEIVDVDAKYFKALGLNPKERVTKEMVNKAFHDAMLKAHPDRGGSKEKAQEVNLARKILLDALKQVG